MGAMENGFFIGCQVGDIELKEILLRRYHTINIPLNTSDFIEFVGYVLESERKEKAEGLYLALIPLLAQNGKFMTFEKFYDEISGKNWDFRSAEDILKESEEIEKRLRNGY